MPTRSEIGFVRRAQIVSLSMTELMLLLVFMAITFSFLAKKEGLSEIPLLAQRLHEARAQIKTLERQKQALRAERDAAQARVADLERFIKGLGLDASTFKPNSGDIPSPNVSTIADAKKRISQLTATINTLRKTLGGKAPGLPKCLVAGTFLLDLTLLPDGRIQGRPAWLTGGSAVAETIPGVSTLASASPLALSEFGAAAAQVTAWGDRQTEPCRFAVRVYYQTRDADLLDRQLSAVEGPFYVRRMRR